jgi:hypothetical protein
MITFTVAVAVFLDYANKERIVSETFSEGQRGATNGS